MDQCWILFSFPVDIYQVKWTLTWQLEKTFLACVPFSLKREVQGIWVPGLILKDGDFPTLGKLSTAFI